MPFKEVIAFFFLRSVQNIEMQCVCVCVFKREFLNVIPGSMSSNDWDLRAKYGYISRLSCVSIRADDRKSA